MVVWGHTYREYNLILSNLSLDEVVFWSANIKALSKDALSLKPQHLQNLLDFCSLWKMLSKRTIVFCSYRRVFLIAIGQWWFMEGLQSTRYIKSSLPKMQYLHLGQKITLKPRYWWHKMHNIRTQKPRSP